MTTTANADRGTRPLRLRAPIALVIAVRYALSTGSFTAFVTRVALLGLVFSVAILLLIMAVLNGFERELLGRLLGVAPHASLHFQQAPGDRHSIHELLGAEREVTAWASVVRGAGMLVVGDKLSGVTLVGVNPDTYTRVSAAPTHITPQSRQFASLAPGRFGAFLGASLADSLAVSVGDSVRLMLSETLSTPFGVLPRSRQLEVLGTLETGTELDSYWMWMHHDDATRLLRATPNAQAIDLRVEQPMQADAIAYRLALATGALDDTWKRRFGPLYQAVISTRGVMFVLLSLLVGVAAFNLVSTLVIVVNQRRPDLAILSTMGASGPSRMAIAAWLGVLIGGFGTALGLALGSVLSLMAPGFHAWMEASFGLGLMDRYFIHYLPTDLDFAEAVRVGAVALSLSLIATLYPALRALALRPAEVLSNE